jgi:ketosteroid isomerase-like protein
LVKKVQKLEDAESIRNMHRDYLFHISNLDMDKALACFSEQIVVEVSDFGRHVGKEPVSRFFREVIRKNVSSSKQGHFTGQGVINVDGDRAEGHWMFYRFLPRPLPERWIQGRYDCEYVKEDGRWKFSRLQMTRPWPDWFK